ncbi:MAG: phosphoribosyl-AMP cyclohydrolase, partial [Elusimicrobia bacterium]|nr:phosphoribosyl-AMP cyclohydrolase [Elusimicrobiota bacterium]
VVQDADDGELLMVAYMNREALLETIEKKRGVFWSRSRNKIWRKGEESGNVQEVKSIALDCDKDCVLIKVKQVGGAACHSGRRSCFFHHVEANGELVIRGEPLFDPDKVYKKS